MLAAQNPIFPGAKPHQVNIFGGFFVSKFLFQNLVFHISKFSLSWCICRIQIFNAHKYFINCDFLKLKKMSVFLLICLLNISGLLRRTRRTARPVSASDGNCRPRDGAARNGRAQIRICRSAPASTHRPSFTLGSTAR